jgi:hypothetical protein
VGPCAYFTVRAIAVVKRHDLRLYLCFYVSEEPLHFFKIDLREFLFDDKSCNGVEIVA